MIWTQTAELVRDPVEKTVCQKPDMAYLCEHIRARGGSHVECRGKKLRRTKLRTSRIAGAKGGRKKMSRGVLFSQDTVLEN